MVSATITHAQDDDSTVPRSLSLSQRGESTSQTVERDRTPPFLERGKTDYNNCSRESSQPIRLFSERTQWKKEGPKLYGCELEVERLKVAYQRVKDCPDNEKSHLVFITGPTGSGKTSLAHSLLPNVNGDDGIFVAWKSDQQHYLEAGRGFDEGFNDLLDHLQKNTPLKLQRLRERSKTEFDDNSRRLLLKIKEEIYPLFGDGNDASGVNFSTVKYLPKTQAGTSNTIFRRLYRFLGTPEEPLVLFFDDIQWADRSSLHWAITLLKDCANRGALFIVAATSEGCFDLNGSDSNELNKEKEQEGYRKVELDWARVMKRLSKDDSVDFTHIDLTDRKADERVITKGIISDAVGSGVDVSDSVVESVHQMCGSNAQFMVDLSYELFVRCDLSPSEPIEDKESFHYLRQRCPTDESMLQVRLANDVSPEVLEVLKLASCFGHWLNETYLCLAAGVPVDEHIQAAFRMGILQRGVHGGASYRFISNTMQRAVYYLMDDIEKASKHYMIGRRMWRHYLGDTGSEGQDIDEGPFVVLTQLHLGWTQIPEQQDKVEIAKLALQCGVTAVEWTSFHSGHSCLHAGIQLIDRNFWRDAYDLALALHNAGAEAAYAIGEYDLAYGYFQAVQKETRSFEDTISTQCTTLLMMSTAMKKPVESCNTGLEVLNKLGERMSPNPRLHQVILEYGRLRYRTLRGRTAESILRLPIMKDPQKLAAMQVINTIFVTSLTSNPKLAAMLAFRMVRLSIQHGLSAASSFAFSLFSMFLCYLGQWDEALKYGKLALKILDRFESKEWMPRVYAVLHSSVYTWFEPFHLVLEPLETGFLVGLETGDMEFAFWNAAMHILYRFQLGVPLTELQMEESKTVEYIETLQRTKTANNYRTLTYLLKTLTATEGAIVKANSKEMQDALKMSPFGEDWKHFQLMFVAYFCGDFEKAVRHGDGFRRTVRLPELSVNTTVFLLIDTLARVALYRSGERRRKLVVVARKNHKTIEKVSQHAPDFCLGKASLAKAELESLRRKKKGALLHYKRATSLSETYKILYEQAMAHELTARYLTEDCDNKRYGLPHLREACRVYRLWGSEHKALQLESTIVEVEDEVLWR